MNTPENTTLDSSTTEPQRAEGDRATSVRSPVEPNNIVEFPQTQECYKTGKPCPYDCSGLCRDAE